jgi:Holliday junction resolvase-like predicted endonuclease
MDLKNTKAIQVACTDKPSKTSVYRIFTDKVSKGSANTARGLSAEDLVIKDLEKQGYQLLARRKKIFHVEMDLVFIRGRSEWLGVEVKTLSSGFDLERRVSRAQLSRLRRVLEYVLETSPQAQLKLAFVSLETEEIQCLDLGDVL